MKNRLNLFLVTSNKGFVLVYTLLMMALLSQFILLHSVDQVTAKQQHKYLRDSQELIDLQKEIIVRAKHMEQEEMTFFYQNYDIMMTKDEDKIDVTAKGKTNFTISMTLDLEKKVIISYNLLAK